MFFSGHSLLDGLSLPLSEIARQTDISLVFTDNMIPGSPIRARAEDYSSLSDLRNPSALDGQGYDTLVITENHNLPRTIQWENTVKYLRLFHDLLVEGNSDAQTYWWHAWLGVDKSNPQPWIDYEKLAVGAWECVAERVNHSLAQEGSTARILNISASGALVALVERLLSEQGIPDLPTGSSRQKLDALFTDDVHISQAGWYYLSLVGYAAIYSQSPVGLPHDAGALSAETARVFQEIAGNYVSEYEANYVPPTLPECVARMTNGVCQAYETMTGDSASDCANLYNSAQDNPLQYDAATDRSYWFPKP